MATSSTARGTKTPLNLVLRDLFRFVDVAGKESSSDQELLEAFVREEDEAAFSCLVRRHSGLVLHVCRRVLHNAQDAEDAFQATFLLLARKASAIRKQQSVASWLYQVAFRLALKAKVQNARRQQRERKAVRSNQTQPPLETAWRELQEVLDLELSRLPVKYQAPLVLCYLEGKTHEEAAQQLGWPLGTVRGRVARARLLLKSRLTKRGLTLSATGMATLFAANVAQAVPARLLGSTIKAALAYAAGKATTAGLATTQALALAEGGLTAMGTTTMKICLSMLLVMGLAVASMAGLAGGPAAAPTDPGSQATAGADDKDKGKEEAGKMADGLPAGATVRLGSPRLWPGGTAFASHGLCFSPDSKVLALIAENQTIHVWETETGKKIHQLGAGKAKKERPGLGYIAFAPDGRTLAAIENGGDIRLWSLDGAKELRVLDGAGPATISSCAFAPDGKTLVAPSKDGFLYRWEVDSGKKLDNLDAHKTGANAVAFSHDGALLASGGEDQVIRLWDTKTWKQVGECAGHRNGVVALDFSRDGKLLASWGKDSRIRIWTPDSGKEIRNWKKSLVGWTRGNERSSAIHFSPNGKTLTVGGFSGHRVFDVATGQLERTVTNATADAVWMVASGDGKYYAGMAAGRIFLLDGGTGRELHRAVGHEGGVLAAAFSPDRKTLATGSKDQTVRLWDLASGKELAKLQGHTGGVSHLRFSADGKHLATASADNGDWTVSWWDVVNHKELRQFRGHHNAIQTMHLAADGKLTTVDGEGKVRVWDTQTGKLVRETAGPRAIAGKLSPDGKTLVFMGGTVLEMQVMNIADKESEPRTFDGQGQAGFSKIAFDHEGRTMVTMGYDTNLRLWDVVGARSLRQMYQPESQPGLGDVSQTCAPAFSPDGRTVAVPGKGRVVLLLEVATGKERQVLRGGQGAISTLAFSPDGRLLVSGSEDGTALVWNVVTGALAPKEKLAEAALENLWKDLSAEDAKQAHTAIRTLVAVPAQAVPWLKKKLPPATEVEQKRIAQLIEDLGGKEFNARKKAETELEKLGLLAKPAMIKALDGKPSLDVSQRLEKLLQSLEDRKLPPEEVRILRAVEVAEAIGTKEARQLFQEWAGGADQSMLTAEARAALARLARHKD